MTPAPTNGPFQSGPIRDPRDPRWARSARSPSPKFSFSTPTKATLASPGNGINSIRIQVIRRLSNLQPTHPDEDEQEASSHSDNENDIDLDDCSNSHIQPNNDMKDTRPLLWQRIRENAGKVDWEIPRKALHSSIGFFTIHLYTSHGTPRLVVLALSTALAIIVPADILRLRYPSFARVYEKCLGFLMRESEKKTSNGVIWYILGVNFVLSVYPLDVATVSILILSWADTAASTVGRLLGPYSPRLPRRVPLLGLPFAERKSLAGFLAASITGACIAMGFWLWIGPVRPADLTWTWETGVASALNQPGWGSRLLSSLGIGSVNFGGWMGLGLIGLIAGLVSGVAEALDLGSLDDNLTLPIISGGFLLGLFRLAGFFSS